MLFNEILYADADILCLQVRIARAKKRATHAHIMHPILQEVDRLEKLIPVLEEAGYGHVYAAAPRKKHGCLIGFRKDSLVVRDQFVLHYDDIDARPHGAEPSGKALSFRTRNVANVVALEKVGQPNEGYVVATTHLFWHPSSVKKNSIETMREIELTRSCALIIFNFHSFY